MHGGKTSLRNYCGESCKITSMQKPVVEPHILFALVLWGDFQGL